MKNNTKTALICGISGQDGAYLADFLLNKGYQVWGTSRNHLGNNFSNLCSLGIRDKIQVISMVPEDFRMVILALNQSEPDEIYYLAGQSSVGLSFSQPAETIQSTVVGMLNILEAVRMSNPDIRIYHAGSSECFGDTHGVAATEQTPFMPRSPYAVAKSSAFWLVNNYREAYNLFVCTGILFNHESPLRPLRFVTQKIISTVNKISQGEKLTLNLGRLDIARDWGWAPEYVEAMWLMLQQAKPEDFVIATGETNTLESFVAFAFAEHNLDWKNHVKQKNELMRPTELQINRANPIKAHDKLGWTATLKMKDVVRKMLDASRNFPPE